MVTQAVSDSPIMKRQKTQVPIVAAPRVLLVKEVVRTAENWIKNKHLWTIECTFVNSKVKPTSTLLICLVQVQSLLNVLRFRFSSNMNLTKQDHIYLVDIPRSNPAKTTTRVEFVEAPTNIKAMAENDKTS